LTEINMPYFQKKSSFKSLTPTTMTASDWVPHERNTLRGFLKLALQSGLVLNDCTLHVSGDSRWVGLPSRPQIDPDGKHRVDPATGKKAYTPVVEVVGKEPRERFQAAALAAVDRMLGGAP